MRRFWCAWDIAAQIVYHPRIFLSKEKIISCCCQEENLEGRYHSEMQRLAGVPVFCVLMDLVYILSPALAHYTLILP